MTKSEPKQTVVRHFSSTEYNSNGQITFAQTPQFQRKQHLLRFLIRSEACPPSALLIPTWCQTFWCPAFKLFQNSKGRRAQAFSRCPSSYPVILFLPVEKGKMKAVPFSPGLSSQPRFSVCSPRHSGICCLLPSLLPLHADEKQDLKHM